MSQEYFKISSGLKNLIGSELITDQHVAIFELVKNSFDANATEVLIKFENIYSGDTKVTIHDNGKGMDYGDLLDKWLFVAYSAKKDGTEDEDDYRSKLGVQRYYAGAKGVGRFSCDRLGRYLNLITRKDKSGSKVENLVLDWLKFEEDQKKEFVTIPVEHNVLNLDDYVLKHGTIIEITGVPQGEWDRNSLKKLKEKLSKLVRPDLNKSLDDKPFKITLEVPEEITNDKHGNSGDSVNGEIKNFIFDELAIRTTKIISEISKDGEYLTTQLIDRTQDVYKLVEKNPFYLLRNVSVGLYFMNRSAKNIFSRRMGIDHVAYGNIFVYKNGFRIYPYGERGDDSLRIDNRAMQGYSRHIGLRSLIGQIVITGQNQELREVTSRDAGLVKTKAYYQLADTDPFAESLLLKTLKRLEKYVVDVTKWGINEEDFRISKDEYSKKELAKLIANISDDNDVVELGYNEQIVDILELKGEKSSKKTVANLKRIAAESKDEKLIQAANILELRIKEQTLALESAEKEIGEKEQKGKELLGALKRQEQETLFARAVVSNESKELISIQHHINRTSANYISALIDKLITSIKGGAAKDELLKIANTIDYENKKIFTLSRFVTKANFDTQVESIDKDLIAFVNEYILNVYAEFNKEIYGDSALKYSFSVPDKFSFKKRFKPIEVIIIVDNLLNNSVKAKAKNINVVWGKGLENEAILRFIDDGQGIENKLLDKIFDFRFTTTDGSGLGLYHVKETVKRMKADISVNNKLRNGVEFIIKFKK